MKKVYYILLVVVFVLALSFFIWAKSGPNGASSHAQYEADVVSLEGKITDVHNYSLTFKTKDREYIVHLGPLWYWKRGDFIIEKGDAEIVGEQGRVDGRWLLYPCKIIQRNSTLILSSDDCNSEWSNSESRQGRRNCRHHDCWHQRYCDRGDCS